MARAVSDAEQQAGRARAAMVLEQLQRRGIADRPVLDVMAHLPREAFVPGAPTSSAYDDRALPIEQGQTISQPYIVARMTELLKVEPGDRILEIGTGSGYQAAVLALLGAKVRSFERYGALARGARERLDRLGIEGVEILVGDGRRAGGARKLARAAGDRRPTRDPGRRSVAAGPAGGRAPRRAHVGREVGRRGYVRPARRRGRLAGGSSR
jgi:protein-L-isoaspartate(D-aspartate) O-methyltransferase